jgi:hypothetical protein
MCGVALSGCSGSDETYTVGNPDNIVIEEEVEAESDDASGVDSDGLVVDVTSTELPDYWPADFPLPEGAVIESVIEIDDSVTVTWILPRADDLASLTSEFSDQLRAVGYEVGESSGTEFFGEGVWSSETHTVEFSITPLEEDTLQLYVTYGPASG